MDQAPPESFQAILRRERTQRGWSQANVAERIGSDPKTVGRWERGLTFPSLYGIKRTWAFFRSVIDLYDYLNKSMTKTSLW